MSAFPIVRPAVESDLPELLRLYELATQHFRDRRGGTVYLARSARHERIDEDFVNDLRSGDRTALVGMINNEIFGFATLRVKELNSISPTRPLAVLEELFVEESARDVGVGAALMNAAIEWAHDKGCSGIDSATLPGDRQTKNFFESFGLVARTIIVHRPIEVEDNG